LPLRVQPDPGASITESRGEVGHPKVVSSIRRVHPAWIVLGAVTLCMMAGTGLRSVFGVYIKPMEASSAGAEAPCPAPPRSRCSSWAPPVPWWAVSPIAGVHDG